MTRFAGVGFILALWFGVDLSAQQSESPIRAPLAAGAQAAGSPDATSRRVFIEAAAVADYDQTDFEPPGPVPAIGFGVGSMLSRRNSLRFELDVPGEHVELFQSSGSEERWSGKTTSYAFLFGWHFRTSRKVQIAVLGGVTALTHRTHLTGFIDVVPRDGRPPTHNVFDDSDDEQWVALTAGVEFPMAITRHLLLVPQLRHHRVANEELGQLFPPGKVIVRPRLSLRWQF